MPPVFTQTVYEVEVMEFTDKVASYSSLPSLHSAHAAVQVRVPVVNVSATAPDGDGVTYSILDCEFL